MPDAMWAVLREDSRPWYFVQLSLVASILYFWTLLKPTLPGQLFLATREPLGHAAEGVVWAAILMLFRFAYVMQPNYRTSSLPEHPFARGPLTFWVLSFVIAGAVEEIWRACCILSLPSGWPGSVISVGGTSIAFVFAHLSGIPGWITGIREEILWELLFAITLGALFVQSGSLILPFLAGLLFNIFNFCLVRYIRAG